MALAPREGLLGLNGEPVSASCQEVVSAGLRWVLETLFSRVCRRNKRVKKPNLSIKRLESGGRRHKNAGFGGKVRRRGSSRLFSEHQPFVAEEWEYFPSRGKATAVTSAALPTTELVINPRFS